MYFCGVIFYILSLIKNPCTLMGNVLCVCACFCVFLFFLCLCFCLRLSGGCRHLPQKCVDWCTGEEFSIQSRS